MKSILLLPIGGSATRMLGLPKFMLPANPEHTLIEQHVLGALDAGYLDVYVIVSEKYFDLFHEFKVSKRLNVNVICLPKATSTMTETLVLGAREIPDFSSCEATIGMADTAFLGESFKEIYFRIRTHAEKVSLGLFKIRSDQFGKLGQVKIDDNGLVVDLKDKTHDCVFPQIWGLAKLPGDLLLKSEVRDAHIGISIEKLLRTGVQVGSALNTAEYFDCGTFNEYKKFLLTSPEVD
jgi:hypothetical protein